MSSETTLHFIYDLISHGIKIWIQADKIELFVPDTVDLQDSQKIFIQQHREDIFSCLQENQVYSKDYEFLILKSNLKKTDLSFSQGRFWFIEKYEQGTNIYHIPLIYQLSPGTDIQILQESIMAIVKRHEILRTLIKETQAGTGYQEVLDFQGNLFKVKNLVVQNIEELDKIIEIEVRLVFDLQNEYPIRVCFYRLNNSITGQTENYISIIVHHIAFDGWSENIFLNELYRYYNYFLQQQVNIKAEFDLAGPSIQYKDFAFWQKHYLSGDRLQKKLDYWRNKLVGYQFLNLLTDRLRPPEIDYTGKDVHFELDEKKSDMLRRLAKKIDVSIYSLLLSAYYLLLRSYTAQDDLIVGTSIANRHSTQVMGLIGPFMNSIAIRINIDSSMLITDFIKQIGSEVSEVQLHQDLPFEKLVEHLETKKDTSKHPVFQTMFSMQEINNIYAENFQSKDSILCKYGVGKEFYTVAKHDISVFINDASHSIKGIFNYAVRLFNTETVKGFIETYLYILDQFIQLDKQSLLFNNNKISDLQYLSETQHEKVIYIWNKTEKNYPTDKNIQYFIEEQANKNPENIAVKFKNIELTYRELNERANQLAHHLKQTANIEPDSLVIVHLERSELMIITILGILKAGGAYVPIDPGCPRDRLKYIVNDTNATVLITNTLHAHNLKEIYSQLAIIAIEDELLQQTLAFQKRTNPHVTSQYNHLAYVIYTSGTTGMPKGVMVEHRSVVNYVFNIKQHVGVSEKDRVDCSTNIAFDLTVTNLICSLCLGATVVVYDGDLHDVNEYSNYLIREEINVIKFTPSYFKMLVGSLVLTSIKRIILGGEKLNYDIIKNIGLLNNNQDLKIFDEYGPTETTVGACISVVYPGCNFNIGKTYDNYKAYVLNADLQPAPMGAIGELYIGGIGLARGYLNNPQLTEEKFIATPWQSKLYKTGDLVRWLFDGNLEYIGRNDDQVKVRGHRVELREIECTLEKHGDVSQAVVIFKKSLLEDQELIAYVVPSEFTPSVVELKEFLSYYLPEYMIPNYIIFLTELPLTPNAKLDKSMLPDPEACRQDSYQAPRNSQEIAMCAIWAEIFGVSPQNIGIHDNFFDLGGHSILAIRMASRVTQEFGVTVNVAMLFRHNTIDKLMTYLKQIPTTFKGESYAF